MAISGFTTWEIQTGGSDTNGGGFVEGSSGTDYSQQTSPQLSLSDGMCMGTTNLNSSTGGFTAAMVGNILYLFSTSGGAEWYEITAYVDTNNVTLDRVGPYDGGMTVNVGGCLATPGGLGQAVVNTVSSVHGQEVWIKSGTYTLTNATANTSGGPCNFTSGRVALFAGYNTTRGDLDNQTERTNKPVIDAGTQTSITVLELSAGHTSRVVAVRNVVVDGNSNASVTGLSHLSGSGYREGSININCHAVACATGFGANKSYSCEADSCTYGFTGAAYDCVAHNGTDGFRGGPNVRCLAYRNTTGFTGVASNAINCTAANNTSVGFFSSYQRMFVNNLAVGNGIGFDFDGSRRCASFNMVAYNNTTDFDLVLDDYSMSRMWNQFTTLTADPFTDAANDDYSLNDTAGGGAVLKQLGMSIPGQTKDTPDFGAVQTNITGGGGGGASSYSFFS